MRPLRIKANMARSLGMRLLGLVAWFSLRARGALGSIPRADLSRQPITKAISASAQPRGGGLAQNFPSRGMLQIAPPPASFMRALVATPRKHCNRNSRSCRTRLRLRIYDEAAKAKGKASEENENKMAEYGAAWRPVGRAGGGAAPKRSVAASRNRATRTLAPGCWR